MSEQVPWLSVDVVDTPPPSKKGSRVGLSYESQAILDYITEKKGKILRFDFGDKGKTIKMRNRVVYLKKRRGLYYKRLYVRDNILYVDTTSANEKDHKTTMQSHVKEQQT